MGLAGRIARLLPSRAHVPLRGARTALGESGWLRSVRQGEPVNVDGDPVPWMTYPALAYFDQRDFSGCDVLEWGAGASTLYWQVRAQSVFSVEHSPEWHRRTVHRTDPGSVTCVLETDEEAYVNAPAGRLFDVVIIDGVHRERCAELAPGLVRDGGLIVVDDADRYPDACRRLRESGQVQVDFWGMAPLITYQRFTSMFFEGTVGPGHLGLPAATY